MGNGCGKISEDNVNIAPATFHLNKKDLVKVKTTSIRDEYTIGRQVGEDKFATIFNCRNNATQKRYVAKFYQVKNVNPKILESFMKEAEMLRNADHPNIIKVIDVYNDSVTAIIVTECCKGGELLSRIKNEGHLTENQVAGYMKQISSALAYLHSKKIVHRDLRLESISFLNADPDSALKITEFGSCKHFEKNIRALERIGTPFYMAPEVIVGNYNEKCDIWSMGVMMHLMLTGEVPFSGRNESEILNNILTTELNFEGKIWKKVSVEARALLKQMLTRSAPDRLSAVEVYQNQWVVARSANQVPDNELMGNTLNNLSKFDTESKLQRATLSFIVSQIMSTDETSGLNSVFRQLDVDGNGMLSVDEIRSGMSRHTGMTDANIEELIRKVDLDANGEVNYSEFLAATIDWGNEMSRERLEQAFKLFDADGSGKISLDELVLAFGGSHQSKQMFLDMINEADTNKDGELDLEEFCTYMNQLKKKPTKEPTPKKHRKHHKKHQDSSD